MLFRSLYILVFHELLVRLCLSLLLLTIQAELLVLLYHLLQPLATLVELQVSLYLLRLLPVTLAGLPVRLYHLLQPLVTLVGPRV